MSRNIIIKSIKMQGLSIVSPQGQSVFNKVDLDLPTHCLTWVTGGPGSGRSVFLKTLIGLVNPSSGSLLINNQSVQDMDYEEIQKIRLSSGYSFDFGGLISNRTLFENLLLPLQYHAVGTHEEQKDRVWKIMDTFKIPKALANIRPSDVQGSVRKAVCVARAFIFDPELVLLDDPTTGLGKESMFALKDHLMHLKEKNKCHIFIAGDDYDFMAGLAEKVIEINDSKLSLINKEVAA